jgi:hypothetical protein
MKIRGTSIAHAREAIIKKDPSNEQSFLLSHTVDSTITPLQSFMILIDLEKMKKLYTYLLAI